MNLIDIGANLTHASFKPDFDTVIRRAVLSGVGRFIVTGATLDGCADALQLALKYPGIMWATAGIHPHHASSYDADVHEKLTHWHALPQVVAVGECGLDYYRDLSPRHAQQFAFEQQLELAVLAQKPVFLHQRDGHADFMSILKNYRSRLGACVVHCFTGTTAELDDYLALDCHIGITGWICDERRGQSVVEAVRHIPANRLMIETDAPYLLPRTIVPPPPHRRNEPCFLPEVLRALAQARADDLTELAKSTTQVAEEFFKI
jgi:TatD DNase family protein